MFNSSGPASSTGTYTGTLKGDDGLPVQLSDLTTLTITLREGETSQGAIINSRDAQNAKNTNNVTFHATSGLLTWNIQAADMRPSSNRSAGSNMKDPRNAVFNATWTSGTKVFQWKVLIEAVDL